MMTALLSLVLSQPLPVVKNVVVVVSDGVRAREIFSGADRALMGAAGGVENEAGCVARFWRDDEQERREVLMPFLWKTVARQGQLFGDARLGSPMRVTNQARVSYPGYNELFSGAADPRLTSNEWRDNPNVTVFEWLRDRGYPFEAFATWATFSKIFAVERSGLRVHAGWEPPFADDEAPTPSKALLDRLFRATTPQFGGNALDSMTVAALEESLVTRRPRVLFLGLGETDEWMHHGRYDLALEALQRADAAIGRLWAELQAMPEYRDSTVLLITTDHGRGVRGAEWKHHGAAIEGAEDVWLGVLGPGIASLGVREAAPTTQAQVASTIAALLGERWATKSPRAAGPLPVGPALLSRRDE